VRPARVRQTIKRVVKTSPRLVKAPSRGRINR
jgi:hypothetical protein